MSRSSSPIDVMRLCVLTLILGAVALVWKTPLHGTEFAGQSSIPADRPGPGSEQVQRCWRRLVEVNFGSASHNGVAQVAIDRFLTTRHGRTLITDLCERFIDDDTGEVRSSIEVRFVDRVPLDDDTAYGCFLPAEPGAEGYEIYVRIEVDDAATEPNVFIFGEYPGNPDCSVVFFYQEAASTMAQTLYHELLHVWFVNAFANEHRRFPTGHGLVSRCEFEEEFFNSLRAHAAELAEIERRLPERLKSQGSSGSRGP